MSEQNKEDGEIVEIENIGKYKIKVKNVVWIRWPFVLYLKGQSIVPTAY